MNDNNINEKNYYDENISGIIDEWITEERYGDLTPIIKDIIYRRAYEFGIKKNDVRVEVENFVRKVKTIEFVHKSEMLLSESCMGVYSPQLSTIRLNIDYFSKLEEKVSQEEFGTKMYETLTHEMYHAFANKNGYSGLEYYSRKNKRWEGTALNEVFTETAANRASITRTPEDAEKYRSETDGYSELTFVTNFLAASLKCTEKEILSAGIQNRVELMKLFYSKFPKDKVSQFKEDFFDPIEASLDILYNASYGQKKSMSKEEYQANMEIRASALKSLYRTTFKLASYQIANDETELSGDYSSHVAYRFSKMDKIMRDSLELFKKYQQITPEMEEQILSDTVVERDILATQVSQINDIVTQSHRVKNPSMMQELENAARKGKLSDYAGYLDKAGIQLHNCDSHNIRSLISQMTDSVSVTGYIMQEDFDNGKQWNNSRVSSIIKKVFDQKMQEMIDREERDTEPIPVIEDTEPVPVLDDTEPLPVVEEGIFAKLKKSVKNIINSFKNRNLKKLNDGNQEYYTDENYYAGLATNKFEQENKLDQYRVDVPQHGLHLEELNVGEVENERQQEDEGR